MAKPVTAEVAELGVVTEPPPEITDHAPVPTPGVVAARFTDDALLQTVCAAPALDALGAASTLIVTWLVDRKSNV